MSARTCLSQGGEDESEGSDLSSAGRGARPPPHPQGPTMGGPAPIRCGFGVPSCPGAAARRPGGPGCCPPSPSPRSRRPPPRPSLTPAPPRGVGGQYVEARRAWHKRRDRPRLAAICTDLYLARHPDIMPGQEAWIRWIGVTPRHEATHQVVETRMSEYVSNKLHAIAEAAREGVRPAPRARGM